jgi:hypothetical protein
MIRILKMIILLNHHTMTIVNGIDRYFEKTISVKEIDSLSGTVTDVSQDPFSKSNRNLTEGQFGIVRQSDLSFKAPFSVLIVFVLIFPSFNNTYKPSHNLITPKTILQTLGITPMA